LGLDSTSVVDPSGVFSNDKSSARDCARLLNYALRYPLIKSALICKHYKFRSLNHRRWIHIANTNRLLDSEWEVEGGKTGYISASGYCLAAKMADKRGNNITVVVLGARSNGKRFANVHALASWAFDTLNHKLAEGGE